MGGLGGQGGGAEKRGDIYNTHINETESNGSYGVAWGQRSGGRGG